jgi:plasmid stabilization system protein ParE
MKYAVVLTREAERNVQSILAWYADRSQSAVDRWYREFTNSITSLTTNPERHALARENPRFPIELRQLNFGGGKRITHRIIYTIRSASVVIYAVRHVAQQNWRPENESAGP